jgi:hypothetical protein
MGIFPNIKVVPDQYIERGTIALLRPITGRDFIILRGEGVSPEKVKDLLDECIAGVVVNIGIEP